ncbi:MAG: hypothetical protein ABWX67_05315 [Allosphingosinicella sp.]
MFELAGGDIILWAEKGGPVMLKTVEKHGDPVELAEHEVQDLIDALEKLLITVRSGE